MRVVDPEPYRRRGLSEVAVRRLEKFGELLLDSGFNVTSVHDPTRLEQIHFLDSLSLLDLDFVRDSRRLVDVGAGGGVPAVVLAIALSDTRVVALESVGKKCRFITKVAQELGLTNITVVCARAEDYGQGQARQGFDVAVARAVAALPVLAELLLPLVVPGGWFVAMKGAMSCQERIGGQKAVAILGGGRLEERKVHPFVDAENHWLVFARKESDSPPGYPRRPGVPGKKPLG